MAFLSNSVLKIKRIKFWFWFLNFFAECFTSNCKMNGKNIRDERDKHYESKYELKKSLTLRKIFIQFHKKFDFETFTTKWMLQNLTFWIEILRFDKSLLNWPTSASQTLIVGEKYQNLSLADWGSKCLLLSGTPCSLLHHIKWLLSRSSLLSKQVST